MSEVVRISVRNLVEFILREGDIDNRRAAGADKEQMQLGAKIHRKIQRQMGADYHAEVSLKLNVPCEGFTLCLEGRADGIIKREDETVIDEIKGVLRELKYIEEPVPVHLAQAKCYAYIYAVQNDLEEIRVQMTYCQMETEEIKRFSQTFSTEELKGWIQIVIKAYEKWAKFQIEWREISRESIRQIQFPYAYREGQKELAMSVYRTILRKKKLFIQAPTGIGKTMATVFPAVKAIGEGLGDKLFYLTAKTITRTVAEQAFQTLKQQNLRCKVITLTAKEKICFCEETVCNPEACPYAKGHYDRVNDAVFDLLTATDDMSRANIEAYARKYEVCPFEMSLDVALWVDAVICDYNYVFDPNAHLKRFFSEGGKEEYLFLIDEAHNLVERAREMYSAALYKEEFLAAKKLVKGIDRKLTRKLEICNQQFLVLKRACETYREYTSVGHIAVSLMNLMSELERFLEETEAEEVREQILEFYFHVRAFLNIYDILDEHYVIYTELGEDDSFLLKLFCVNPAVNLQEYLSRGNSTIFFSATMLPIRYYKKLLSVEKEDYAIYAASPFQKEHRKLFVGRDVSTKYTKRTGQMYERFASYIAAALRAKKGNYIAFFPSYRFLEEVYERFKQYETEDVICIVQEQSMDEEKREAFLKAFDEERTESLIGFSVMGGIFSEGIDLTEERLIGTFLVGTGLPQVCNEREILKQYFDRHGEAGFSYAYLYPGMNKVLQAAGRVIRTAADRGVILLLDERFLERQYQEVFPREWDDYETGTIKTAEESMRRFWEQ
ncbi:MAG: ATP-dependent DNA helicase [Lachnospiraceae bacterium]|nr:ATP-dependent DNA helicase [Lachnospiraceae bacterium]